MTGSGGADPLATPAARRLPPQPATRALNAPPATLAICAAFLLVHAILSVLPVELEYAVLENLAFVPESFLGQFENGAVDGQELATLLTYAFVHHDLLHLVLNTGFLLAFGSLVERMLGAARYLLLFALTAVAAALAQAWAVGAAPVAVIGGSGAVYGMLGAAVPYLYSGGLHSGGLDSRGLSGRRGGLVFVVVVMGLNLLFGLLGLGGFFSDAEVAWQAHIGGFAAGLLLVRPLAPRRGR